MTAMVAVCSAMTVVGMSGIFFMGPDTVDVDPLKTQRPSSKCGLDGKRGLLRIAHAGEGELRVPPCELPIIHLGLEVDAVAGIFWNLQPVVHGVGRAWWNQSHVGHRSRGPRVPFVDGIAVAVEQEGAIEMRAFIDWSAAAVGGRAAMQQRASAIVGRLEFHPHIERVDRAAREEVPDFAGAHDHFDARRLAAPHPRVDLPERPDHVRRRPYDLRAGAEIDRFFTDGERAREARLGCGCRNLLLPVQVCRPARCRTHRP